VRNAVDCAALLGWCGDNLEVWILTLPFNPDEQPARHIAEPLTEQLAEKTVQSRASISHFHFDFEFGAESGSKSGFVLGL